MWRFDVECNYSFTVPFFFSLSYLPIAPVAGTLGAGAVRGVKALHSPHPPPLPRGHNALLGLFFIAHWGSALYIPQRGRLHRTLLSRALLALSAVNGVLRQPPKCVSIYRVAADAHACGGAVATGLIRSPWSAVTLS